MGVCGRSCCTQLLPGDKVEGQVRVLPNFPKEVVGQVRDVGSYLAFKPDALHATEAWPASQSRVVIVVYTVGCWSNASSDLRERLEKLQFSLPAGQEKGGEGLGVGVGTPPSTQSFDSEVKGVEVLGLSEKQAPCAGLHVDLDVPLLACCKVCEAHLLDSGECSECGLWQDVSGQACVKLGVNPEAEAQLSAGSEDACEGNRVVCESVGDPWSSLRVACDSTVVSRPKAEAQLSAESEDASEGGSLLREGVCDVWLSTVFESEAPDVSSGEACQGDRDGDTLPESFGALVGSSLEESLFADKASVAVESRDLESGDELMQEMSDADDAASVFSRCTASEGEVEQMDDEQVWSFQQLADHVKELDKAQLRLSGFAESRLAAWIDGASHCESDAAHSSLEDIQQVWETVENMREELKTLAAVEVQVDAESGGVSQEGERVLQTRLVSLPEVLANCEVWAEPAKQEVGALVTEKRALIPVNWKQVELWRQRGTRVTTIPAKCVWSVKAPLGRLKCRVVACGNLAPPKEETKQGHHDNVFASSLDITHLRIALAWATRRKCEVATVDVRTAFLNAKLLPRNRASAELAAKQDSQARVAVGVDGDSEDPEVVGEELVVLVPPRCLVQRGVVHRSVLWRVAKAIYGLDTSPRDWCLSRDNTLETLEVRVDNKTLKLFQPYSEPNLWLLAEAEPERSWCSSGLGLDTSVTSEVHIWGWLGVYIDDLMVAAAKRVAEAVLQAITRQWACGEVEWVTQSLERPLRFLGLELAWSAERALLLGQNSYVKELAARYETELAGVKVAEVPLSLGTQEPESEDAALEDLRKCQRLIDEVLWLSVRT